MVLPLPWILHVHTPETSRPLSVSSHNTVFIQCDVHTICHDKKAKFTLKFPFLFSFFFFRIRFERVIQLNKSTAHAFIYCPDSILNLFKNTTTLFILSRGKILGGISKVIAQKTHRSENQLGLKPTHLNLYLCSPLRFPCSLIGL